MARDTRVSRLVAVSNRVVLPGQAATAGGLAIGLAATLRARGGLWFGWNGEVVDDIHAAHTVRQQHDGVEFVTRPLRHRQHRDYYQGFCNGLLWPLLHGLDLPGSTSSCEWQAYADVNRQFAHALRPWLRADDLIWVHDFHLMLLAGELRRSGVTQPLGFFLHVPFATPAQWQRLDCADRLLQGLLAYDVIGFQTARDLESFRAVVGLRHGPAVFAADDCIRLGAHTVRVGVWPIGVDIDALRSAASRGQICADPALPKVDTDGASLIVGVDRLQASKGLEPRLQGYAQLLRDTTTLHGRPACLQVIATPGTEAPAQAALRSRLRLIVAGIRDREADAPCAPVQLLERTLPHADALALLRRARIACVTPLRDGMNLVAKEFIAVQDPADPGVLVLSRHAGAACELTASLRVDPTDPTAIAAVLRQALAMPRGERRARHAAMLAALRRQDLAAWHHGFLSALAAGTASRTDEPCQSTITRAAALPSPGRRRSTRPIST